jgi:hypothetical protein
MTPQMHNSPIFAIFPMDTVGSTAMNNSLPRNLPLFDANKDRAHTPVPHSKSGLSHPVNLRVPHSPTTIHIEPQRTYTSW